MYAMRIEGETVAEVEAKRWKDVRKKDAVIRRKMEEYADKNSRLDHRLKICYDRGMALRTFNSGTHFRIHMRTI